jgi:HAD superfamily hydrolase (TIGR01484 family)
MATYYDIELGKLSSTYDVALTVDISHIKVAIASMSESSILGVGSGGSFTVASLLCKLHETYTGRVSRPSTPLEIICNPTLAASSPVFFISAEGKNPDIIEALQRARRHSARTIHVLTNRSVCPLIDCIQNLTDISKHVFELVEKDGYLATNSLLLDAILIARAYGELDTKPNCLPNSIDKLRLRELSIDEWLIEAKSFAVEIARRGNLIIIYSPLLSPVAADLESKLSEAALIHCQVIDMRSFAHGRHLWLSDRPKDCAILALVEPTLESLCERMLAIIPTGIPTLTMSLGGSKPPDLLAGLVAQMKLVSTIAERTDKDPGRPNVLRFSRDLHYLELNSLIPPPEELSNRGVQSKYSVLGARWPSISRQSSMQRAFENFKNQIEKQIFRAIVFDYDGTLCSSHRNDLPPPEIMIKQLCRILEAGILIGIATGRGGSIQEHLQRDLPKSLWQNVQLGLYSSGLLTNIETMIPDKNETSEFLSHVTRIVRRLKNLGVPIDNIRTTHPYQVSVRFREGVQTEENWFVIADAMRQAGLDLSRIVRSKHSIDILGVGVDKSHLVAYIIQKFKINPFQVLTIGDQGAWPGNDSSLLEHRFSLSVDVPSRRLDRGWNLAPSYKMDVDATVWYLEHIQLLKEGYFKIQLPEPSKRG